MIIYSTQFRVIEDFDEKTFLQLIIHWNEESGYPLENFEWDGETYSFIAEGIDKRLTTEYLEEQKIIAARFENKTNAGIWKADFILNREKGYMTVTLTHETNEFTTNFQPRREPPRLVRMLMERGYTLPDGDLTVDDPAYAYDDHKETVDVAINDCQSARLPLVLLTKSEKGDFCVNPKVLGRMLRGAAYVIYEAEKGFDESVKACADGQCAAIIIYPQKGRANDVVILNNGVPELLQNQIRDKVYAYGRDLLREPTDTWEGVINAKLHQRNLALNKDFDNLYDEFGDMLDKSEMDYKQKLEDNRLLLDEYDKENRDLVNRNMYLENENNTLRTRLSEKKGDAVITAGDENSFYPDEIKEIILDILFEYEKKLTNKNTRRVDVIKDILKNNGYAGLQDKRGKEITNALIGYRKMTSALRGKLNDFGIDKITHEGKHHKLYYYGDDRYWTEASCTASASGAGEAIAKKIIEIML